MKTIGLLGGMSWESTVTYYQVINETIKEKLGGLHSAKILLYSVDFDEIERCQSSGDWEKSAAILRDAAQHLEAAGADFIVICTNTMHKVAEEIKAGLSVPLLHIAEATAQKLTEAGITQVGLPAQGDHKQKTPADCLSFKAIDGRRLCKNAGNDILQRDKGNGADFICHSFFPSRSP
jgi:aspartate racemase